MALKVNSIEESRENANKIYAKEQRITDFRYNAYKEVSSIIFDVIKAVMPGNDGISPILIIQFKFTLEGYSKLFASIANFDLNQMVEKLYEFKDIEKEGQLKIIGELNQLMKKVVSESVLISQDKNELKYFMYSFLLSEGVIKYDLRKIINWLKSCIEEMSVG